MKSVAILDQNLGYVDCNVCGAGYNHVAVSLFADNSFTVTRTSKCYGNVTEEFVDAIFLREWLQRNSFLIATKYARETMTAFVKDLDEGKFTYANVTGNPDPEPELLDNAALANWATTVQAASDSLLTLGRNASAATFTFRVNRDYDATETIQYQDYLPEDGPDQLCPEGTCYTCDEVRG